MKVRVPALLLLATAFLLAQSENYVDSVRISPDRGACGPTNQAGCLNIGSWNSSAFTATNVSLDLLVAIGYSVDLRNIEHLDRLHGNHYDVSIKPESGGSVSRERARPMLRAFLKERFRLETHSDKKQEAGYALVVTKGGPRLQESDPNDKVLGNINDGSLVLRRATLDQIAGLLSNPLGKTVVNETGISGTFNVDLRFAPEGAEPSQTGTPRPSIFTAVQEQLGLKLEPRKITSDILVIDNCEPMPSGN
jgi:uncharacterized protein (TIGR03435 family)